MNLSFLKIDRVTSKCDYAHHADWIECLSFNDLSKNRGPGASPHIGRKDVEVSILQGIHSPTLFHMSTTGGHPFVSAVFEMGLKNGDAKFTLQLRVRMTDVFFHRYYFDQDRTTGSKVDQMILSCGTLAFEYGSASQLLP